MLDSILSGTFCAISGLVLICKEGLFPPNGILCPLICWSLWLASGCLAATAAELLNKPVLPHLFLGLLLPYVYPVWFIRHAHYSAERQKAQDEEEELQAQETRKNGLAERFQAMHEKRAQERAARLGIAAPAAVPAAVPTAEPAAVPAAAPAAVPAVDNEIHDLLYAQPVDADGCRPGPYQFTLKDGTTIDVANIRSMNQDHMICILTATGKSVRFRYAQVDSVARYE